MGRIYVQKMGKESLLNLFKHTISLSTEKAEEIASFFHEKVIAKNEYLLREGQLNDEYLFLENGFMRAYAINMEGQEVVTDFFGPGQLVFEVTSYFNRTRSKENIQALTDCAGYFLVYKDLNSLFHAVPEFREFGRAVLVKGFSAFKSRVLSMITESAEERYLHLLEKNPEIFQHAPLKYIASYLGITDSSLSRIRATFLKK